MVGFVPLLAVFGVFGIASGYPSIIIHFNTDSTSDGEVSHSPAFPTNYNRSVTNSHTIGFGEPTPIIFEGDTPRPPLEPANVAISFDVPVQASPNAPIGPVQTIPDVYIGDDDCPLDHAKAYYNGKCEYLLNQGSCYSREWLVVNKYTGLPECQLRKCPEGEVYFIDSCVSTDASQVCNEGEMLYLNFAGETHCDCENEFVFDVQDGKCYPVNMQGSCPFGQVLSLSDDNKVMCIENICSREDLVYNPDDNNCYTKNYVGDCSPNKKRRILFVPETLTATCDPIDRRNIFEVPTLTSCPAGSQRDSLGYCKQVFSVSPRNAFGYRVPTQIVSRYSCPSGFTKYPDGSCKKLNSILGR